LGSMGLYVMALWRYGVMMLGRNIVTALYC
jgi:hypothetical protein